MVYSHFIVGMILLFYFPLLLRLPRSSGCGVKRTYEVYAHITLYPVSIPDWQVCCAQNGKG